MLTLYQLEWCASCHAVRQVLTELGLTYIAVNVPFKHEERAQVIAVSGQDSVPVLQDGDRVLTDSAAIVEHLRASYPSPDDAAAQAEMGAWRLVRQLSVSPHAAATLARRLLAEKGFHIVAEARGPDISEQLPREYLLLAVVLPEAAARAVEIDNRAPGAVVVPVVVIPREGGGSLLAAADPVGQVWLHGDASLREAQTLVKRRLVEMIAAL